MTNGGSSRTTVSAVRFTSSPSSSAAPTTGKRRAIEIESPDEAGAAHLANDGTPRGDGPQPALEVSADRGDVRHQIAVDQLLEKHQRGAAREKVAAIRAAVITERRRFRDPLAEQRGSDRNAGAERLADRHQVRLEPEHAGVERPAGAAEAALDFIGNEQRARAAARLGDRICHRLAERPDAAFALKRLEDDRAGRFGDRRAAARPDRFGETNCTSGSSGANGAR